jgi:hypothetical protein
LLNVSKVSVVFQMSLGLGGDEGAAGGDGVGLAQPQPSEAAQEIDPGRR